MNSSVHGRYPAQRDETYGRDTGESTLAVRLMTVAGEFELAKKRQINALEEKISSLNSDISELNMTVHELEHSEKKLLNELTQLNAEASVKSRLEEECLRVLDKNIIDTRLDVLTSISEYSKLAEKVARISGFLEKMEDYIPRLQTKLNSVFGNVVKTDGLVSRFSEKSETNSNTTLAEITNNQDELMNNVEDCLMMLLELRTLNNGVQGQFRNSIEGFETISTLREKYLACSKEAMFEAAAVGDEAVMEHFWLPHAYILAESNLENYEDHYPNNCLAHEISTSIIPSSLAKDASQALLKALGCGHINLVQKLFHMGVRLEFPFVEQNLADLECKHVREPLFYVRASEGDDIMVTLRYAADMRWTILHLAAATGNDRVLDFVLGNSNSDSETYFEAGQAGDINMRDAYLRTPLHLAAISNSPVSIRLLLMRGADPNARDINGHTAMGLSKGTYIKDGKHFYTGELTPTPPSPDAATILQDSGVLFWNATVRANKAYSERKYALAIKSYTSAIELAEGGRVSVSGRDQATLYYNRGRARYRLGAYCMAIEDCSSALNFDPTYKNALAQRAECYMSLFDFERAVRDFATILEYSNERQWLQRLSDAKTLRDMSHYALLGVPRNADNAAIKRAYRAACLKWHPDKAVATVTPVATTPSALNGPGEGTSEDADPTGGASNEEEVRANAAFRRITEAYGVLSDPHKRMQYDMDHRSHIGTVYDTHSRLFGADAAQTNFRSGIDIWAQKEKEKDSERDSQRVAEEEKENLIEKENTTKRLQARAQRLRQLQAITNGKATDPGSPQSDAYSGEVDEQAFMEKRQELAHSLAQQRALVDELRSKRLASRTENSQSSKEATKGPKVDLVAGPIKKAPSASDSGKLEEGPKESTSSSPSTPQNPENTSNTENHANGKDKPQTHPASSASNTKVVAGGSDELKGTFDSEPIRTSFEPLSTKSSPHSRGFASKTSVPPPVVPTREATAPSKDEKKTPGSAMEGSPAPSSGTDSSDKKSSSPTPQDDTEIAQLTAQSEIKSPVAQTQSVLRKWGIGAEADTADADSHAKSSVAANEQSISTDEKPMSAHSVQENVLKYLQSYDGHDDMLYDEESRISKLKSSAMAALRKGDATEESDSIDVRSPDRKTLKSTLPSDHWAKMLKSAHGKTISEKLLAGLAGPSALYYTQNAESSEEDTDYEEESEYGSENDASDDEDESFIRSFNGNPLQTSLPIDDI